MKRLALILITSLPSPVMAQHADQPVIAQFFSYRLIDTPKFQEGYRKHLDWHARHNDRLNWYGWTVQAGPRRGLFIDGTAGASLAALDARPDLAGDGADFAMTAGSYAQPVDVETWSLWARPSSARTLEEQKPGKIIDVFLLEVSPSQSQKFERDIVSLVSGSPAGGPRLTWYRKLRGGSLATYMVMLTRENWAELGNAGGTFVGTLTRAFGASPDRTTSALAPIKSLVSETWVYEPQLSLLSGQSLAR